MDREMGRKHTILDFNCSSQNTLYSWNTFAFDKHQMEKWEYNGSVYHKF